MLLFRCKDYNVKQDSKTDYASFLNIRTSNTVKSINKKYCFQDKVSYGIKIITLEPQFTLTLYAPDSVEMSYRLRLFI